MASRPIWVSIALSASILCPSGFAAEPPGRAEAGAVQVTVDGIATQAGLVRVGLFRGAAAFDDNAVSVGETVTAEADSVTVTFSDLEPGRYGIKLYHDVNGDGEMNTNLFGLPAEPFAFSNNAMGRFGPPQFAAAGFDIAAGATALQVISLRQP